MNFTKMHGLGNDFILIDGKGLRDDEFPALSRRLCDRHRGIGADGLILLLPSERGITRMRLFNSDGSEAEMCGNGIRCLAKYVHDSGIAKERDFIIETKAGLMEVQVTSGDTIKSHVKVLMGSPRLLRRDIPLSGPRDERFINERIVAGGREYMATCLNVGNPHCVMFVQDFKGLDLKREGSEIEHLPLFPEKTNVEFVRARSASALEVKVWERGAGETMACGTGACAALVAAHLNGISGRTAEVELPGGSLSISWREDGKILMEGPAEKVFAGEIPIQSN
jgi:diaminopimelate epimerase